MRQIYVRRRWVTIKQEKERFLIRVGKKVEVSFDEEHLRDAWFPATIVKDLGKNMFLVKYNCRGSNGESELQRVSIDHIRPQVPFECGYFNILDKVDAFYDFGWWSGVITEKLADSRFVVYFKHTNTSKEFSNLELRLHWEWKDDKWLIDEEEEERFLIRVGKKVEVSFDEEHLRDAWFPARIVDDPGKNMFLVEYNCRGSDGLSKLQRVSIDHLHIRPQVPYAWRTIYFKTFDKVDAFYDFGWWSGEITKVITCGRYVVYFEHTNTSKEFSHLELRSHWEWKDDKWFIDEVSAFNDAVQDEPRKNATLSHTNQIGDTPTGVDKQTHSVTPSVKRSKLTDLGSSDKLIKPCKKSKAGIASPDPNLSNEVPSKEVSNQSVGQSQTVDKTMRLLCGKKTPDKQDKSVDLERPTVTSARKEVNLSADSRGPKALLKGKKPPGNIIIPPSVTNGNDQKWSFEKRSSFWETIESMEAFHLVPQNPHFRPLDNVKESARERHAIYKMVDFACVFQDMCRLQLDHSRTEIEDHLETLLELESHGFDVDSLRNRLMEMLSWKDKCEALESGSKEAEDNLENERVKVEEHNNDIALIERQIAELSDKRERLVKENEESTLKIVGWEAEVDANEEAKRECDRKFCELATAPF